MQKVNVSPHSPIVNCYAFDVKHVALRSRYVISWMQTSPLYLRKYKIGSLGWKYSSTVYEREASVIMNNHQNPL